MPINLIPLRINGNILALSEFPATFPHTVATPDNLDVLNRIMLHYSLLYLGNNQNTFLSGLLSSSIIITCFTPNFCDFYLLSFLTIAVIFSYPIYVYSNTAHTTCSPRH